VPNRPFFSIPAEKEKPGEGRLSIGRSSSAGGNLSGSFKTIPPRVKLDQKEVELEQRVVGGQIGNLTK